MNKDQGIAVTYVGSDEPFVDRIYRSGLTFDHGQTRTVPTPLGARFLLHTDVFKRADVVAAKAEHKQAAAKKPDDDTAQVLDQAKKDDDARRELDEARFSLLDQLDSMDKAGLIDWAQQHYKQKIPHNLGEAKVRDMAKGFIDQYGPV